MTNSVGCIEVIYSYRMCTKNVKSAGTPQYYFECIQILIFYLHQTYCRLNTSMVLWEMKTFLPVLKRVATFIILMSTTRALRFHVS